VRTVNHCNATGFLFSFVYAVNIAVHTLKSRLINPLQHSKPIHQECRPVEHHLRGPTLMPPTSSARPQVSHMQPLPMATFLIALPRRFVTIKICAAIARFTGACEHSLLTKVLPAWTGLYCISISKTVYEHMCFSLAVLYQECSEYIIF